MANPTTEIAWATGTCNPFKGCSKASAECANCYMTGWAYRHQCMGSTGYEGTVSGEKGRRFPTGKIGVVEKEINELRTVTTERLFVNSMSDTFHENVDDATIHRVFDAMDANSKGTNFLICTKRSERMSKMSAFLPISPKVWMGVTCGCVKSLCRLDDLRKVNAAVRFVSVEPLLEPIDLSPWLADGTLNWVIVGGESGKGWRNMDKAWAEAILRQCQQFNIPFFLKQWSAFKPKTGAEYPPTIDGQVWHQFPVVPSEHKVA
jgi:protein gp37